MFGDLMGMMGKIKETQEKVEATKKRLDTVLIDEKSSDGFLEVTLTANRKIKNISISDDLLQDKEMLEDLIAAAFNDGVRRVAETSKEKMGDVTGGMPLPPGFKMPF